MKIQSIVFILLLLFGCSNDKVFENKSNSFAELIIEKVKDEYYLSIKFTNHTNDTLGIYSVGRIREKNQKDNSLKINKIMYDIILEVNQNEHFIKSTDLNFNESILDNKIPELNIIYPNSNFNLPIRSSFNIRKEFSLQSEKFKLRAIYEPPIEFIKEDTLANSLLKKNKNIKLIKNKIETPFLLVE